MAKHQKKPAPKTNPVAADHNATLPYKRASPLVDWSAIAEKCGCQALLTNNNDSATWLTATFGKNIEDKVLNIQKDWVRPGANTIQFIYDTDRKKDPVPGFQVYALALYGK